MIQFCTLTLLFLEFDSCAVSPCVHGSCTDLVGGYNCTCTEGWTGSDCDVGRYHDRKYMKRCRIMIAMRLMLQQLN